MSTTDSMGQLNQNGSSLVRSGLSAQNVKQIAAARAALANQGTPRATGPDPLIDNIWAGYNPTESPHSYFDYYFSGQDIKVYIDGLEGYPEFATIPISDFSWNVTQQKMPIYGFWSWTFDALAKGSRIINGSFRLVTKAPDYMRRCLEAAAEVRQTKGGKATSYSYFRGLTEDDANIEKYWSNNLDPALASVGKQIFSTHPAFSFVIVFGVQNVSLNAANASLNGLGAVLKGYDDDNPLYQDTNERLVDSDPVNQANRIILDDCELVNMSTEYHSNGQLIVEDYQFIARDYVIPSRNSTSNQSVVSTVL